MGRGKGVHVNVEDYEFVLLAGIGCRQGLNIVRLWREFAVPMGANGRGQCEYDHASPCQQAHGQLFPYKRRV